MKGEGLRKRKGFTLIELAIVLVIIGIILGAVLKGQDLIQNARQKKFITKVRAWEAATWAYYDRLGYFPGDAGRDGKIGDQSGESYKNDITVANFINPPYETYGNGTVENAITLGSNTFYVFFGTDNNGKNIMTICVSNDCNTPFNIQQIQFAQALDRTIDGVSAGYAGQVVGSNAAPDKVDETDWEASFSSNVTASSWLNGSTKAIVYYFDAKR